MGRYVIHGHRDELVITVGRRREHVALYVRQGPVQKWRTLGSAGPRDIVELLRTTQREHPRQGLLILGENGTGKELVARSIHFHGPRKHGPFVPVDCTGLVSTLVESELFGYVKGAFTGASQPKRGLIEAASGGTLFLDEIGELPMEMQAKLLRVLQEREVRPVGATSTVPVDVRVVAATNRDLQKEVDRGSFRQDLFYRLSVVPIRMPPLRERKSDIPLIVSHFLERYATRLVGPELTFQGCSFRQGARRLMSGGNTNLDGWPQRMGAQ